MLNMIFWPFLAIFGTHGGMEIIYFFVLVGYPSLEPYSLEPQPEPQPRTPV